MNKKRLIVENETDVGYCHNKKCHLHNLMIGCCGQEEGDKPICPACNKPHYTLTDGSGLYGDCEVDL